MGQQTTDTATEQASVLLGVVVSAHGIRGQFKVKPFTAEPLSVAAYGEVELESGQRLVLQAKSTAKGLVLCSSPQITSREQAEQLKGMSFSVTRQMLPAPDADELYHADMLGMQVITPEGTNLGIVVGLHDFGAGDVLEIQPQGAKTTSFLPFYPPFLIALEPESRRIIIDSQSV
jgi:16S rRNA processing protein RimM